MRGFIGSDVELLAVVKADAYGHGAIMIAKTMFASGVSRVAVYTLPEALSLRHAGIERPILVLGPISPSDAPSCVALNITPAIASLDLARALSESAATAERILPYHVEIDTGLTRYGVLATEVLDFVKELRSLPNLDPEGLFTHYASADEPVKESVWRQFESFNQSRQMLQQHGFTFRMYHVAASAAALEYPEMHLDMVRCGISLYGYYPSEFVRRAVDLQPILTVRSILARVRSVPEGTGISYGSEYRCSRPSVIGLVPFGYADGIPRSVYKTGQVLVRGRRVPIVGRVAMDQFMVDLTNVDGVMEGDEVVIIGRSGNEMINADDVAGWAGTISYEVLTRLSVRVPRVYFDKGRPVAFRVPMSTQVFPVTGSSG
jgi:alanine racemase